MSSRGPAAVALVESATQLLNVAEWAYAAGETGNLRVDVLAPKADRFTVRQLRRVAELVRELELDIHILTVRGRGAGTALDGARVARDIAGADQLVVGDPFSRFIQTLLPLFRAERLVVVDDGTATWEFVRCVDAEAPMVRWQVPHRGGEFRATRATRRYKPGPGRTLEVFSCLQGAPPAAALAVANTYAWVRSWRRPEVVEGEVDVLGVSLVDTGVIERRDYVAAVAAIARRHESVRYLAHRRETDSLVGEIAAIPGVRIARGDMPIELALREGPVARHVIAFPSTAAHTLPVVLGDLGLRIEVRRVEDSWFTPGTTARARAFVARIADSAPLPPVPDLDTARARPA